MVYNDDKQSNGSNVENTPPPSSGRAAKKPVVPSRYRGHHSQRRRRARFTEQQAAARLKHQISFQVRNIVPDVEMANNDNASSSSSSSSKILPVMLPRELGRPEFCEVSREALVAVDPELKAVEPSYLRDSLEAVGSSFLKTLASVRASAAPDVLPKELEIIVQDLSTALPTHMLAVYGPPTQQQQQKRKVTLYPAHSLYLAANCARLPPFTHVPNSTPPAPTPDSSSQVRYKVPVRPLCLPSPSSYPRLSSYIYTKRPDVLLASLLPITPPHNILSSPPFPEQEQEDAQVERAKEHHKIMSDYAYAMAATYTSQVLLQHALLVHGLWQNTCALGIFDPGLWHVIDLAWTVLLTALAVSTGKTAHDVLGQPPS